MKLKPFIAVLLLLIPCVTLAQRTTLPPSGGITPVAALPATCTPGGANAVVNLSTGGWPSFAVCVAPNQFDLIGPFHGGYQGLSPQDFGARGDGREVDDAVVTSGTATVTSATAGFCNGTTVACTGLEGNGQAKTSDVGRQFEVVCASSQGALTVLSVQSATSITLSANNTTCNGAGTHIFLGTDDTAALQAWITAGMALHTLHNFYIPKGLYYTSKPLYFNNPNGAAECSAHVNIGAPIRCGMLLYGAGTTASIIHPATQPNFNWTLNGTDHEGVVRIQNVAFGAAANFAVSGDQITYSATGLTSNASGFYIDVGNAHFTANEMWVNRIVTSGPTQSYGWTDTGCFECSFYNSAVEGNGTTGNALITLAEKELYDTFYFEAPTGNGATPLVISGSGIKQARFHNIHTQSAGAANVGNILLSNSLSITAGHSIEFDEVRMDSGSTTDVGFWVAACTGGTIEINNSNLINAQNVGTERTLRVDSGVTCNVNVNGGTLNAGASGVAVLNNATPGPCPNGCVYLNGVTVTGSISGTGSTFGLIETATGWGGNGGISGSYFGADFTGSTTPTLSAGTGACSTTSTQVGGSWAGTFVCTGATAASTITIAPGTTAAHGWACSASDVTAGTTGSQSGTATTTCTIKFASVTQNDVISFQAFRF